MKGWVAVFALWAGFATAAPETSVRPENRTPGRASLEQAITGTTATEAETSRTTAALGKGLSLSLRPETRPRKFRRLALERARLRKKGAVCEDIDIQGDVVGRVTSKNSGCGISNAVRVQSVSNVKLSQKAYMDCNTAKALKSWVENVAKPTLAKEGGGLKRLRVAAHYACRTRNNKAGARISEHGKGRAIDISGFVLRDGTLITVRNGWNGKDTRKALRQLHRGACGPFGTVLGPESDRHHKDHFHFDTARYSGGAYCR